jgi:UDP-N-acetylmuramate--alanine ligase
MLNSEGEPGNAVCGGSSPMVIEADESDGSIALYNPTVGIVTNISLDHKPLDELKNLFGEFCRRSDTAVSNINCEDSDNLDAEVSFGIESPAADFNATRVNSSMVGAAFKVNDQRVRLRVPGLHNVSNAAAAIAATGQLGVSVKDAADTLYSFLGIRRRLQLVGERAGIRVIDDFAHNPDKISASLRTLKEQKGRLIVMFQPTGFAPTRFLKDGLIQAFAQGLDTSDLLLMPEIYYAGGTASKDISSSDLVKPIARNGISAEFVSERAEIGRRVVKEARAGDRVVIMGARDDTLTEFARNILNQFEDSSALDVKETTS